jgi:uncharacterized protein (TIGR03067 family)
MLLVAAALASVAFAPAPFPRPDRRTDLQKMQGTWVVVADSLDWLRVVVGRDRMSMQQDGKTLREYIVRLGAGTIDCKEVGSGRTFLGIYRFDGGALLLRIANPGMPRPKSFVNKAPGHALLSLMRQTR